MYSENCCLLVHPSQHSANPAASLLRVDLYVITTSVCLCSCLLVVGIYSINMGDRSSVYVDELKSLLATKANLGGQSGDTLRQACVEELVNNEQEYLNSLDFIVTVRQSMIDNMRA